MRRFLEAFYLLTDEAWEAFQTGLQEVHFDRKYIITREGQTERWMYFVLEGLQRSYYIKDGKEYTMAFTYPPSFSGIPESFLTQTPSRYFLEAITPSHMLRLSYEKLEALSEKFIEIERLRRKAAEMVLVGIAVRQYELLAYNAEEKFRALLKRSPHVLNLIPHKYLASYLGLDPATFSKLLHRIKV